MSQSNLTFVNAKRAQHRYQSGIMPAVCNELPSGVQQQL